MSSALDRETDRIEEALDELRRTLRRAPGLDVHGPSTLVERRGLGSDEDDTPREPVTPTPDIPIEHAEAIPYQRDPGPYWSAPRSRSWIDITRRFVGVAAVAAVAALVVGKLASSWNLATTGQLQNQPSLALGLSEPSKSEGFDWPAPSSQENAVDKEPPGRPGERAFVNAPSRLTIEGSARSERAPPSAGAQNAAPPTAQTTAPSFITRQLDRDELAALLRRGEDFITSGDIASARLVLQRAAEAGNAHAALTLAATFDPNLLAKLGLDFRADVVKARFWYERAEQLGSTEAQRRLEQLASHVNSVP